MKSCLKCKTPPNTPNPPATGTSTPTAAAAPPQAAHAALTAAQQQACNAKHVQFCDGDKFQRIHFVDDWDRTPAEVARHLSYEEILELKQIRYSLPRAEQPPDVAPYHPHYLKQVPIHILPLLPDLAAAAQSQYAAYPPTATPARNMFGPAPSVVAVPAAHPASHPPSPPTTPPPPPSLPPRNHRFSGMSFLPLLPPTEPKAVPAPAPPPPARNRFNMTFLPLLPSAEEATPTPAAADTPAPAASEKPTAGHHEAAVTAAAVPRGTAEPEDSLPTPSSTPALTARSLSSDTESSCPPSPHGPRSPLTPVDGPAASAPPHFLDAFPCPPSTLPPVPSEATSRTLSPPPTARADEHAAAKENNNLATPDALALRLSTLGLLGAGSASSAASTPGSAHSGNGSASPGARETGTLLQQSGYFHLPFPPRRVPTAQSAVPSHLRAALGAGALPDSPCVDPMFAPRPSPAAPTTTAPTTASSSSGARSSRSTPSSAATSASASREPSPARPDRPYYEINGILYDAETHDEVGHAAPPSPAFELALPQKPRFPGAAMKRCMAWPSRAKAQAQVPPAPAPKEVPAATAVVQKVLAPHAVSALRLEALPSPSLAPPSPFFLNSPPAGVGAQQAMAQGAQTASPP